MEREWSDPKYWTGIGIIEIKEKSDKHDENKIPPAMRASVQLYFQNILFSRSLSEKKK